MCTGRCIFRVDHQASTSPRPNVMLSSCWFLRTRHDSEQMVGPQQPPSLPRISTQATRDAGTTWDGRRQTRNTRGDGVLPEPPVNAMSRLMMPSTCAALQSARTGGVPERRSYRGHDACRRSWPGPPTAVDTAARWGWKSSGAAVRRAWTTITSTTLKTRGYATHSRGAHVPVTPPGPCPAQKGMRTGSPQPFAVRRPFGPGATVLRPKFDDWHFQISHRRRSGPRTPLRSQSYPAVRGE